MVLHERCHIHCVVKKNGAPMTDIPQSALRREQSIFAFFRHKLADFLKRLRPKPAFFSNLDTPHISNHIAKDIGLSEAELEQRRRRWPSEENRW